MREPAHNRSGKSFLSKAPSMFTRGLVGVAVMAMAVSGCGSGDEEPEAKATVTATVTVTGSPSPVITESPEPTSSDSEDAFAPNVGERALTVGDTREGSALRTALKSIKYPYPPAEYRQPEPGNVFLGLELEQCVKPDAEVDADQPFYSTYNSEWSAVTPDGFEFGGDGSSWNDWPNPKFHESVTMGPGRCLKGWIAVQVPKGTKIASLIWRPDGVETAEWLPK